MTSSSSKTPTHQRNGKGKQKVRMAKMENKRNLQVTFSKRRYGLFKKASELCTLTGSEAGIIVFSPGRKVFSFGNPSIHKIINGCFPEEREGGRAKNCSVLMPRCDERLMEANQSASVAEQNLRLSMVEIQMEGVKRWTATIEEREKAEMEGHVGIEGMMEGELVDLGTRLNTLKESMKVMGSFEVVPDHATSFHPILW